MTHIVVVEDDDRIRAHLEFQLAGAGYRVTCLERAEDAFVLLRPDDAAHEGGVGVNPPDLLLLDVRLPGLSGVELVRSLAAREGLPPTILISGEATLAEAVEALRLGVFDFIEKPFGKERLLRSVANALDHADLRRQLATLSSQMVGEGRLLGDSEAMERLRRQIAQAAPTEGRVLILGESGTGKELVADALHRGSPRRERPFVKINCAAIPENLVEGELFGHARGAFTDARTDRPGLFEEADGGTLFLDEIGDMPPALQARLLRVLEDGKVRRLGESRERQVDVRLLAATHHDLEAALEAGRFRRDLYFRLAHLTLEVPPLRQRRRDVRELFEHFVEQARRRHRAGRRHIEDDVFPILQTYSWPGNVRELKAVAERLVVFGGDPISAQRVAATLPSHEAAGAVNRDGRVLAPTLAADGDFLPLREFRHECEREYILRVLEAEDWNVSATARVLAIQRTYLHQKMSNLGISRPA